MGTPLADSASPLDKNSLDTSSLDSAQQWRADNLTRLYFKVAVVRSWLEHYLNLAKGESAPLPPVPLGEPESGMDPPALVHLGQVFDLSRFEQQILLLALAVELDPQLNQLCAQIQGNSSLAFLTVHLAASILPGASWGAFLPDAPLLRWELVRMESSASFSLSPLRIDPSIMLYLMGEPLRDRQLQHLIHPLPLSRFEEIAPSHQQITEKICSIWLNTKPEQQRLPVIQLCCPEFTDVQAILAEICARLHKAAYYISLTQLAATPSIASDSSNLQLLLRRWERMAQLTGWVLVVDGYDLSAEGPHGQLLQQIVFALQTPVVLANANKTFLRDRQVLTFDIAHLTPAEQQAVWKHYLGSTLTNHLGPNLALLIAHFNLSGTAIAAICQQALAQLQDIQGIAPEELLNQIWTICRQQARPRLDALAQRIETNLGWEDLIVPETQLDTLKTVIAHTQTRAKVYQTWGWQKRSNRGLGISALFHGLSGTGKTTAAEVIARELNLDLYRIDLSAVVSKYIGETEKNLSQIFNAAEAGGVVLLFDEADALFGKRGEVREARDRYANQEVSYLLQRMETYSGLAILTTNLKSSMDPAFERRIRFVVEFVFPDRLQRQQLWQQVFPPDTPTQNLDYKRLARLNVSGGVIRNIALGAAFMAAKDDERVGMNHLALAARSEGLKANITQLVESAIQDWL